MSDIHLPNPAAKVYELAQALDQHAHDALVIPTGIVHVFDWEPYRELVEYLHQQCQRHLEIRDIK